VTLRIGLCFLLLLGACGDPPDEGWLGYGEGDSAMISAPQPGWVTELKVERGQVVRPGDLLFVLDSTQQQASRDQAQATLAQARVTCLALFVPSELIETGLDKERGHGEEETDAGADSDAVAADRGGDVTG
jgi:HlyD family secretion protein